MPGLDDTLAALMARPRTTMRLGTSTASLSAVSVAGGTVSVDRWINAPSGAGEPVVLLMQDGAVVASVADAGGYVKRVVVTSSNGNLPTSSAIWTWTQSGLPSHEGPQTAAMFNGSGRFQAPWDGLYRLEGTIRADAISGGYPARFGGEVLRTDSRLQLWGYGYANGGAAALAHLNVAVGLNAGDYIQVTIGTANATGGYVSPGYGATRVSWTYEGAH